MKGVRRVLRTASLIVSCSARRTAPGTARVLTLGRISFNVRTNRDVTIVKPSNSNGSALLRTLTNVVAPATNGIVFHNTGLTQLDSTSHAGLHHDTFNFIFRSKRLLPRLPTVRGVTLPVVLNNTDCRRTASVTVL